MLTQFLAFAPLLSACLLVAATGAQARPPVALVVHVEGATSYVPGQPLYEGARLEVPAGTTLELADAALSKRQVIPGPYDGPLPAGLLPSRRPAGSPSRLSELLPFLDALRSASVRSGPDRAPDAWLIAVDKGGDRCLEAGRAPVLWQPPPRVDVELVLTHEPSATTQAVVWPHGHQTLAWPAAVPFEDGAEYVVDVAAFNRYHRFRLHRVASGRMGIGETAATLLALGCHAQGLLLLEQLPAQAARTH